MGNRLFNFALDLFVPPNFRKITHEMLIIVGIHCFSSEGQMIFTYPETAGKMVEEIDVLFSPGGSRPWKTKPGGSRLDAEIARACWGVWTCHNPSHAHLGRLGAKPWHTNWVVIDALGSPHLKFFRDSKNLLLNAFQHALII